MSLSCVSQCTLQGHVLVRLADDAVCVSGIIVLMMQHWGHFDAYLADATWIHPCQSTVQRVPGTLQGFPLHEAQQCEQGPELEVSSWQAALSVCLPCP
jgi:hypothetical protein